MQKSIIVKKDQQLVLPLLWIGDESEMHYTIRLSGIGASVSVIGLLLGSEQQTLEMKLNVIHEAPQTKSNVSIKSALTDRARVNIDGMVTVKPGAKGTDAWLGGHLLLLSPKAHGRATPSLEILENDLKAGHAATVGRINDLEMFYLMSRGLSKTDARRLIVEGFLQETIDQFPSRLKKKAAEAIQKITTNDILSLRFADKQSGNLV